MSLNFNAYVDYPSYCTLTNGCVRLPDDLTEEEKLEPIACEADDLRTKQYNNLLARKRKQLADSKVANAPVIFHVDRSASVIWELYNVV